MRKDIQKIVLNFGKCAKTRGTSRKLQNNMQLFPEFFQLELVTIYNLGPLPLPNEVNRFVLEITYRFSKPGTGSDLPPQYLNGQSKSTNSFGVQFNDE